MSDTSLIFNLLAIDSVTNILGKVGGGFDKLAVAVAASAVDAGYHMLTMAGDFQEGITALATGAGEAQANLGMVSQGILKMSGDVGESTKDLNAGMYLVESAGFHAADGLTVLKDAAEGAKVGQADMATVADAVTTGLNAYHQSADKAAQVTNALIAAVGEGKSNMGAMAGSLADVAPAAAAAGVSLNEVLGAEATMTAQGTDAANAATYLRQTILQLSNPTAKARNEMESLGLDSIQVSQNLGKNGLAATLTELTDAIQSHMGPAGTVLIEKLRAAGSNATKFQQILANLPPTQQTYVAALADMVGGTKSMQAALELTGGNMATFKNNTQMINEKVKEGGDSIAGWDEVQKDFNVQLAQAKGKIEAVGISIGTVLIPAFSAIVGAIADVVGWFQQHKVAADVLAVALGVLAAIYAQIKLAEFLGFLKTIPAAIKEWTAAQWALDAAMDANVISIIIIAIAALVVVIIYLWTHSAAFRNFFIGLWNDIWGFLKAIGAWFAGPFANFFVQLGKDIAAPFLWLWHEVIYPAFEGIKLEISIAVQIITSIFNLWVWFIRNTVGVVVMWLWHDLIEPAFKGIAAVAMWLWHERIEPAFKAIGAIASWVWDNLLHPAFTDIMAGVKIVGDTFSSIFSDIGGYIRSAFDGAVSFIKGVLNDIIDVINGATGGVNDLINAVNKVPGVNFPHIPAIPHLAAGGMATRGGLALVGEQGAEVVRLNAGDAVYPHGTGPGGNGGDTYVVNNITVNGIDKLKELLDFLENRKNNGRRGLGMA